MALEKLLKIKNSLIAGYLFSKIQEIEKCGIGVRYKVELDGTPIPEYRLIEALGTLFAHAMESLAETELPTKKILFSLKQKGSKATIKFAYTSDFLELDDMVAIWEKGGKYKGKERGNSLYQLKKLVKDNGGNIYVHMKTVDTVNYLCIKAALPCAK